MRAWRWIASGCILALAVTGCGGDYTNQSSTSVRRDLISEEEAVAIAQAEVPGGEFVRAELYIEDDDEKEPRWGVEFYVAADDAIVQVEVHAVTGSVRGDLISVAEAVAIAQAEVPDGKFVRAELDLEDYDEKEPRWEVEFYVAADDAIVQVELHAVTGEVLEIKVEDDGLARAQPAVGIGQHYHRDQSGIL